jgi:hypothetical protein
MDEKKLSIHSWGELYETLLEMKEKGDDPHDELFARVFDLFPKLDKAQTLTEVREIIDKDAWFTKTELDRINSLCLDGILNTINVNGTTPMSALVSDHAKYLETLKFYATKVKEDDIFSGIFYSIINNRNEIFEVLLPFMDDKSSMKKYIVWLCSILDRKKFLEMTAVQKSTWLKQHTERPDFLRYNYSFLQHIDRQDMNSLKTYLDYWQLLKPTED